MLCWGVQEHDARPGGHDFQGEHLRNAVGSGLFVFNLFPEDKFRGKNCGTFSKIVGKFVRICPR